MEPTIYRFNVKAAAAHATMTLTASLSREIGHRKLAFGDGCCFTHLFRARNLLKQRLLAQYGEGTY
jgi:hypothetical protein